MESNPDSVYEDIGYKSEHSPESAQAIQKALGRRPIGEANMSAPRDEEGKYIIDKIEPGMYLPGWGPVLGQKPHGSDPGFDNIAEYPGKVPLRARSYFAAQEYARRMNKGDADKIAEWLAHARNHKWAKAPRQKR